MRKLVITGGVASGKTHAVNWIKEQLKERVAVFHADRCVHELLAQEKNKTAIIKQFGEGLLLENQIDRSLLSQRIFASKQERIWLEELLHPQVAQCRLEWAAKIEADKESKICWLIAEIPLWYEAEVVWDVDSVLFIGCDPSVQVHRLQHLRGFSQEHSYALVKAQWSAARKIIPSDFVCWNDGSFLSFQQQLQYSLSFSLHE